jgi:hypothetical protein
MTKRILRRQIGCSDQWPKPRPQAATLRQRVKKAGERLNGAVALGRQYAGSAADRLSFAAAPTFAMMALLTGILGGGAPDMLCSAAHGVSPLGGMAQMYLLMSAFHLAPWLKWMSRR